MLHPDITVLDEVTHIKNYRAKTTQNIKRYFRTPYRWALSGTPLENRLSELFSIMQWIDPAILGSWQSFSDRYLIIKERVIKRRGRRHRFKEVVGYKNLAELRDQLRGWMLRRRKRDVLPDLPEVTFNTHYVQLSRAERHVYSIIDRYVDRIYGTYGRSGVTLSNVVFLRECCDHPALVNHVLRELGYEAVEAESSKLDVLLTLLEDFGDRKIVIYSEWVKMLKRIAEVIPFEHEMLYGGLSDKQRVNVIRRFTKEPYVQVLLSSEMGRFGLNLQVADVVINFDLHWNPAKLQQRVGRLERHGQKNPITCINLVAEDTIEEDVLKTLREKTDLFRKVIDGDFSDHSYENAIWQILEKRYGCGRRRRRW